MLIDGFLYLLAFAIRVRRGDVFSARRSIHVIIPGELADDGISTHVAFASRAYPVTSAISPSSIGNLGG